MANRIRLKKLFVGVMLTWLVFVLVWCARVASAVGTSSSLTPHELVGTRLGSAIAPDAPTRGQWAESSAGNKIFPTRDVPVHISLLPNGRLLYWGRDKAADGWDIQGQSNTYIWDPLFPDEANISAEFKNAYMNKPNGTTNLFCSGHSFLQDGTLLVAGGHQRWPVDPNNPNDPGMPKTEGVGEDDVNAFDYRTNTWSLVTHMQSGRWYPRSLTLADGRTFIQSGSYLVNTISGIWLNSTPEIFGLDGNLTIASRDPYIGQTSSFSVYPFISLAPDGRLYYAGAPGDISNRFFNVASNSWATTLKSMAVHDTGTAVTYAPGKMMVAGGRHIASIGNDPFGHPIYKTQPSSRVQLMNLNLASGNTTPDWFEAQALQNPRIQVTGSVILPDGKVMVVGGTICPSTNSIKWNLNHDSDTELPPCENGAVLNPELWTPGDSNNPGGSWGPPLAPHQEPRVYHSTAVLLPDGRVLVGGGGLPLAEGETSPAGIFCYGQATDSFNCRNYGHKNFEIFSPPYLFEMGSNGAQEAGRPVIVSAPESVAYNQQFKINVGDANPAADIADVVLIRLPSATHGSDPDQRRVVLTSQPTGDGSGLTVTAPPDGITCPPGPYMLFLIRNNGRGTPSLAKMIRVGSFSLDHSSDTFHSAAVGSASALAGQIVVTAPAGQNWTATVAASHPWITITSGASGTGNGFINFQVSSNTTPDMISGARPVNRSGTISIKPTGQRFGGMDFTVYQAANFDDIIYPPSPTPTALYDNISKIYARGVTLGCGSNNYCPNSPVTREQMAAFLARAVGFKVVAAANLTPTPVSLTSVFADVSVSSSSHQYIDFIRRLGITNGCATAPQRFCPTQNVTRAEMAVFIVRALGMKAPPAPTMQTFNDVPTTHWAAAFIAEAARRRITFGFEDQTYHPEEAITREQMAAFLSRAFQY
ncbi:MAG TPA: galactose oxidase-like domain-containing protein [Pyrinomonadaceae bacterium]|nr:galactose oxidase-like domain-containing protein [Pyrinomonadaceae bacterium]